MPRLMKQQEEPQPSMIDRRSEPRIRCCGRISLLLQGSEQIQAEVVDCSLHGYRLRLPGPVLTAGQTVCLCYSWGLVVARVIWTKEANNEYESGLYVP